MIKSYLRWILCLVVLVTSGGCADGVKDRKHKQRQMELLDREALRESFRPLVGIYDGQVFNAATGEDPFPILMEVFIGEEPDGLTEDGEMMLRPELRAWYVRLDQGRDNTSSEKYLIGRYYRETSALSFVSQARNMGTRDAVSFVGSFNDNVISGDFSNYRGSLGRLTVKKRVAR